MYKEFDYNTKIIVFFFLLLYLERKKDCRDIARRWGEEGGEGVEGEGWAYGVKGSLTFPATLSENLFRNDHN